MNWPFIKFYPRDWQADPELRMCSLEARGFWLECLCIMHSAQRRGFLESPKGHKLDDEQLARLTCTFKGDVYRCKSELLKHGVPSICEETGVWYCRRMVRETKKSEKCSQAGKYGGGNPDVTISKKNKERIPEYHISLNVTFKGASMSVEDAFEIFWKTYPKRSGSNPKKNAFKKFSSALKRGVSADDIISGAEKLSLYHQSKGDDGSEFVPMAQTWLNQERWEDEIKPYKKPPNPTAKPLQTGTY